VSAGRVEAGASALDAGVPVVSEGALGCVVVVVLSVESALVSLTAPREPPGFFFFCTSVGMASERPCAEGRVLLHAQSRGSGLVQIYPPLEPGYGSIQLPDCSVRRARARHSQIPTSAALSYVQALRRLNPAPSVPSLPSLPFPLRFAPSRKPRLPLSLSYLACNCLEGRFRPLPASLAGEPAPCPCLGT